MSIIQGVVRMKINRVLLIGIIVAIFSVGFASADQTILLTQSNAGINGFVVTVNTYTDTNEMSVQITTAPAEYTVDDIDAVYYNLDSNVISVDGKPIADTNWKINDDKNVAGFGRFAKRVTENPSTGTNVMFELKDMADIPFNENGHRVVVHLRFGDDESEIVTLSENDDGSTFLTDIPEFPTIALPVAAILGLMFIFGRKRDL